MSEQLTALELFQQQAVTISKTGDNVELNCDSWEDAETVYEWLTSLGGEKPQPAYRGIAVGEMPANVQAAIEKTMREHGLLPSSGSSSEGGG